MDPEDIKSLLTNSGIAPSSNIEIQKKIASLKISIIAALKELSTNLQEIRRSLLTDKQSDITQLTSLSTALSAILKVKCIEKYSINVAATTPFAARVVF